jgi:hypothetical protein
LKVKGDKKTIWFNSEIKHMRAVGGTGIAGDLSSDLSDLSDSSSMGRLIKKKKAELGI